MTNRLLFSSQRAIIALAAQTRRVATEARGERGSAMTEYGLLIAFVFVVAIGSVGLFGEAVVGLFRDTNDEYVRSAAILGTP